jgi:hypothetical protein
MNERKVTVTERYHPKGRTVVVEGIPAAEITVDDQTHVLFDADVVDRTRTLVHRALDSSDAAEFRITYSAADTVASSS